jgi:hypothetical protein
LIAHAGENWKLSTKEGRSLSLKEIWDDDEFILTQEERELKEGETVPEIQIQTQVQKGDQIKVYWGMISQDIGYTGERDSFLEEVQKAFKIPGSFELKTGIDDHVHDFKYEKMECCHIVEIIFPVTEVEVWSPPIEIPDLEPPPRR